MSNFLEKHCEKKLLSPLDLSHLITAANMNRRALSAIVMESDRQLFTTYKQQDHCGVSTDLWRGLCARDYFSDDQYRYYREQLERHLGQACEVTYRAFRIDPISLGMGEERLLTVRAETVQSTYGWVRLVETIADEAVPAI